MRTFTRITCLLFLVALGLQVIPWDSNPGVFRCIVDLFGGGMAVILLVSPDNIEF